MLAKITSKNQLTLPKAAIDAVVASAGPTEYFDVEVRQGQIVLTPVRIQRGDAVRAKLSELGLNDADVAAAVQWARSTIPAQGVAEPPAPYRPRKVTRKVTRKSAGKAARKAGVGRK
jgi:translation initiation factor IF-1